LDNEASSILACNIDDLLTEALRLAIDAHAGKRDKAGLPYILHPLSVMLAVESLPQKVVAILHDAVEDSPLSTGDLRERGFPDSILAALDAITRNPSESYEEYIEKVGANQIARIVKIADLKHNLDLSRLRSVNQIDIARLQRYVASLAKLSGASAPKETTDI
jgi:GTP diphosphokinase / guanosine-3',5'-bis(diphosphate) 3'-diphosphatase